MLTQFSFCIILESKADIRKENSISNKKFKCEFFECNKSFAYSRNLRLHVQKIHEKISFKCDHCSRIFTENASLKKHIKVVHLNMKNHKCDQCDKSFGKKEVLTLILKLCMEKRKIVNVTNAENVMDENQIFKGTSEIFICSKNQLSHFFPHLTNLVKLNFCNIYDNS